MKLNFDTCISFLGKNVWFFVIGAVVLFVLSAVLIVSALITDMDIDQIIVATIVLFVSILMFALSKFAIKIRVLNEAGGPQAFYEQTIEWPLPLFYSDMIEECGVKAEFDVWVQGEDKPLTIQRLEGGLLQAMQMAYSLPIG